MQAEEAHTEICTKELEDGAFETRITRSGDKHLLLTAMAVSVGSLLMELWEDKDIARHQAELFIEKVMNAIDTEIEIEGDCEDETA